MILRRILAAFFIFLFAVVSLPTFFVYGFSQTFFNPLFYSGAVSGVTYDFLVDTIAENFYRSDSTLARHFQEVDINKAIRESFTPDLFQNIMVDVGIQLRHLKAKPTEPAMLSFKVFRSSLLTASHNLAFNLFQSLPNCKSNQFSEVNEEGIPTCIPKNVDYTQVAGPLSKQFEKAVFSLFPEQIEIDLNSAAYQSRETLMTVFSGIDRARVYLFGLLLLLMVIITLIIYEPMSLMLKYEAIAFLLAGMLGFIASFIFQLLPALFWESFAKKTDEFAFFLNGQPRFRHFLEAVFSFPMGEMQKLALIFMILGVVLFVVHLFLKQGKLFRR